MPYKARKPRSAAKAAAAKQKTASQKKTAPAPKYSSPSESTTSSFLDASAARSNQTHIFFWGGILSNWHNSGEPFSGARCFELALPDLQTLTSRPPPSPSSDTNPTVTYPEPTAISTRLISDHNFNCGEQWMMAMKAWFFERSLPLSEQQTSPCDEADYQTLKAQMYLTRMPKEWTTGVDATRYERERAMWQGSLCQILRTKNPRLQKALGRRVDGWDARVWDRVSVPCVVAACVARAETNPDGLRRVYLAAGKRVFVEGSPLDTIWGVGIHWKNAAIEEPRNWCGENRLGRCHDEAARKVRDMFNEGVFGFGEVGREDEKEAVDQGEDESR